MTNGNLPHKTPEGRSRYSLGAAISGQILRMTGDKSAQYDGFELEVSQEIGRYLNRKPEGFFVPLDAPVHALELNRSATMVAGTAPYAEGAVGVPLVEVLRTKSVLGRLGMEMPIALGEPYPIPTNRAKVTNAWKNHLGTSPPDLSGIEMPDVTTAAFAPKMVVAGFEFTRRTARDQEAVERAAVRRLCEALASEVDRVGLVGGEDEEPLGLLNDGDIPVYPIGANGGAATWAAACAMEERLGGTRADLEAVGWISSGKGRSRLRQTYRGDSGSEVWTDRDTIAGRRAIATDHVPTNLTKGTGTDLTALILGRFDEMVMPLFWAVDLLINPFEHDRRQVVRITATLYADVRRLDAESFVVCKDIATA